MRQTPLAGQQVRIIDAGDNYDFFKDGDIGTITSADDDGDFWVRFPDGEEWCIGTGSKNTRCQSDEYTKWELVPAQQPQNLQSQLELTDEAIKLLIQFAYDGDLWGYASPEDGSDEAAEMDTIYNAYSKLQEINKQEGEQYE